MQFPYQRVLIVGCGGAGKSTLAREMGARFCLPVVHLDRLWWLPGWVERSEAAFDADLAAVLKKPRWVMDGNYLHTLPQRAAACDGVVFLDIPPEVCLQGVRERAEEYCGRTRPDMTEGCEERIDAEFEAWIRAFPQETRGRVLSILQEAGVPTHRFCSREEAMSWLFSFDAVRISEK